MSNAHLNVQQFMMLRYYVETAGTDMVWILHIEASLNHRQ